MKTPISLMLIFLSVPTLWSCQRTEEKQTEKPNIVVFFVDDMGWQDTSVPFWTEITEWNKRYHTPNMEKLASQGMKFTQAYAHSVCSPSRTSLLTGMNPARHGVTNWTLRKDISTDHEDEVLEFPAWNLNGLQPVDTINNSIFATTLPSILRAHGYHTIHVGKAHWGAMDTPGANPLNLGFDINIAGHAAGGLGSYLGENNFGNATPGAHTLPWGVPGMEKYHGHSIHLTEALTLEAIAALNEAKKKDQPFFLYFSHYTVHIPLEADERFYDKYQNLEEPEAKYASMVEGMDKSLGDIMNYLQQNNLDENTIIIFISDNGGLSATARGGIPHQHSSPLNSGKGSAYEGGIRIPMLIKWPNVTVPGSSFEDYLIIEDLFPSLLHMANVTTPTIVQTVDGENLTPHLQGKAQGKFREKPLIWHYPNNWGPTGPGIGATSTIREGDWKLVYWYKYEKRELFNIREDIGELIDRSTENPEKVMELAKKLADYLKEVNAFRPKDKRSGEFIAWPDEGLL
ncbi:sulfatase [Cecembia lonarensis]|uniref:Arylsulfatase n=1 Tax=Cecembia lonarensis (strain CCUG 58316 / KCTC 22772 / LW9) TaxID=1225176 RepID=K1M4H4_CECL9|nr:sulfatase [Cecembia lonarensis]EKB51149.1 Arylsulfatase [Cecembia lonarensis LW9]